MSTKVLSSIVCNKGLVTSATTVNSTADKQVLIRDGTALLFRGLTAADVGGIPAAYTDEQAADAAAALFTTGVHSGISFAYDDAANRVNATVTVPPDYITAVADTATVDLTVAGGALSAAARVQMSLDFDGGGLKLAGDLTSPGNAKLYGTDSAGVKGWYSQPVGTQEGVWRFSTNTTIADPGAGLFRCNAATVAATTQIALDIMTDRGADATSMLKLLRSGDQLRVQDQNNSANYVRYVLTADPVDGTGFFTLSVALYQPNSYGGTAPTNNSPCVFTFAATSGGAGYSDENAQDAAAALFGAGTHVGIDFVYDDANGRINATVSDAVLAQVPASPGGRLTLAAGTPVTTSDTTSATLRYVGHLSDLIFLWDAAASRWRPVRFVETAVNSSGLADTNYDVFGRLSGGALALELLQWSGSAPGASTRQTAVTLQDGRYCKSGDKSRLYLGTARTNAAGQFADTARERFVWNMYNRVTRELVVKETTDTWTYTVNAWRPANNSALNRAEVVVGFAEDVVELTPTCYVAHTLGQVTFATGVGVNSVSVNSAQTFGAAVPVANVGVATFGSFRKVPPSAGYHHYYWLERSGTASGVMTWIGDAGIPNDLQTGMVGSIRC